MSKRHVVKIFPTLLGIGLIICLNSLPAYSLELDSIGGDFSCYWASIHLLINGQNPYSIEHNVKIQQSVKQNHPVFAYSPPWLFTCIIPFSFGNYHLFNCVWISMMLLLLYICVFWLWHIYEGNKDKRYLSLITLITFTPVFYTLLIGQIVPLILVGLVGFLYFVEKKNWWIAALFTIFLTLKPQILYLFWIALLFWIIENRNWKFGFKILIVNLLFLSIPLIFNHQVYNQYFIATSSQSFAYYWATPTIGTFLRFFWGDKHWLQLIPSIAGLVWFAIYWIKNRHRWEWKQEIPLLIIISLLTTFYCWEHDYILILIPLVQMLAWITNQQKIITKFVFVIIIYFITNTLDFTDYLLHFGEHHGILLLVVITLCYLLIMTDRRFSISQRMQRSRL